MMTLDTLSLLGLWIRIDQSQRLRAMSLHRELGRAVNTIQKMLRMIRCKKEHYEVGE
jgi:hypothetical protein